MKYSRDNFSLLCHELLPSKDSRKFSHRTLNPSKSLTEFNSRRKRVYLAETPTFIQMNVLFNEYDSANNFVMRHIKLI